MAFLQERKIKGKTYVYIDHSMRIRDKVHKISQNIGRKDKLSKKKIDDNLRKFSLDIDKKILDLRLKNIEKNLKFSYPLTFDEAKKIEEMALRYKTIKKKLNKKDWEDIKKRFVANFVFESNALEGNSLTLRNFSDIVFENRTSKAADLREVNDAKNSFAVFSSLFSSRKKITQKFIIDLHKSLMKNIDGRIGYKKVPNIILGKRISLTSPEDVEKEIKDLLAWYRLNKGKTHPLELALRFHHRFEKIHPFADGNGRVGRMILNYILIRQGYFPLIIRKTQRNRYLKALESADNNKYIPLMRFGMQKAKDTYRKFFEVYCRYL